MITKEQLHTMFEYKDGTLYRKISFGRTKAGDKVGFVNDKGYLSVNINSKNLLVHRLIWMMHFDEMPSLLDHIDGNRQNNKIDNLRIANRFQNAHNKNMNKNNTSGVKGVCWHKHTKKWNAQIWHNKKHYHLGLYESLQKAKEVVMNARNMFHGEFANHGINDLKARVEALENK
jgi:hypothetical protein